MLGSETAEDIATSRNIDESEVPIKDAIAAVVHGSKLKVRLKYGALKSFTILTQMIDKYVISQDFKFFNEYLKSFIGHDRRRP